MSKRKQAMASKRARPRTAARAQRNKQAIVRSPKDTPLRSVAATESLLKLRDDSKLKAPVVENRLAALQDGSSQMMRNNNPKRGFDFSLGIANMQAYQAKLLEMAQANMQFAFEFSQRLATIRSPFEFVAVIAEFTSTRIDMFGKDSKELAAYPFWGASGELTALPR